MTVEYIDSVLLFTDGGCRGNPGPGAIGILITDGHEISLKSISKCIGQTTNNRAEYEALIVGLDMCAKYTRGTVTCFSDSALLVKQMNGVWRLKNDQLRQLWHKVTNHSRVFERVIYQHVKRTNPMIVKADRLVNYALEGRPT